MKKNDVMDTSGAYSYGLDLSGIKIDNSETVKNHKISKRYICIDLEMSEYRSGHQVTIPGCKGEVIQFGAVMLDENYNMISKFSSYVKPAYSCVTPVIHELTGITNENLKGADDFITVFDKFCYWRGEGDITTFCWSKSDHNQLWNELEAKGSHRYDLFACLKDFVDLQKIFGNLVSSKAAVSLESAMKLLQMEYKGQIHTAYSDSYNTARILHKIFCTEFLEPEFEYINPDEYKKDHKPADKTPSENYNCSFASFMSPELLAQFGISADFEEEDAESEMEEALVEEDFEIPESSPLAVLAADEEFLSLCAKYRISIKNWFKFADEVMKTEEMSAA